MGEMTEVEKAYRDWLETYWASAASLTTWDAYLAATVWQVEQAVALDVYLTEGEHGDLDMSDGARCFDAGVAAYRAKLKALLSVQETGDKNGS